MSEKYIVALVVESNYSTPGIHGILWKETCKHSCNRMSKPSVEIVQYQFWIMHRGLAFFL